MKPTDHSEYAVTFEVRISKRGKTNSRTLSLAQVSSPATSVAEAEKIAKPFSKLLMKELFRGRPIKWLDGGYLGNGRCSFMQGSLSGPCCYLPHDHTGGHCA